MAAHDDIEHWASVANSCRNILQTFSSEVIAVLNVQLQPGTQAANFKTIMKQTPIASDDKLLNLLEKIWDYLPSVLHRAQATKADAERAYLWTNLAIAEAATAILPKT